MNTTLPQPPQQNGRFDLDKIARMLKLLLQCITLAGAIVAAIVTFLLQFNGAAKKTVDAITQSFKKDPVLYDRLAQEGDQVFNLGMHCEMTRERVTKLNKDHIKDLDEIKEGKTYITLEGKGWYDVREDGPLNKIAAECFVTVKELMRTNNKGRNFVYKGERLVIPHHIGVK